MPQAVKSNLDESCILYQHKERDEIKNQLKKDFENIYDWFVGNKLRIHIGKKKTKSILFSSKYRAKNAFQLNITYTNINMKQQSYLRCVLEKKIWGEAVT